MRKPESCPFCGSELEYQEHVARLADGHPVLRYWTHLKTGCILDGLEVPVDQASEWNRRAVVRCRDCRKDGLLECPLVFMEHRRLVFLCHDPDWYCADGEPGEVGK